MPLNRLFAQFLSLQCLDVMTTLAFLEKGVQEANPLVNLAVGHTESALGGLILIKLLALLFAGFCWMSQRERTLWRVNRLFVAVVVWNMVAILVADVDLAASGTALMH